MILRITTLSPNLRFEELQKVLGSYGYVMHKPGKGGNHYTFRKPGKPAITLVKDVPIKPAYIKMVKK